jgi:hypothetical protein
MSQKQLLFVMFGLIFIGIAILTEYASAKIPTSWTMAKNEVSGSVSKPVIISNNIVYPGTNGREDFFPFPLQNSVRAINRQSLYGKVQINVLL